MNQFRRIAAAVAAMGVAAVAIASPVIKWDSTRHDFGAFSEDLSTVTCTFKGVNVGDEPLVIYDVKPNCGCTTTERYAGQEYAPGDSIFIRTTYNAVGRPGRFSKKVMIHSNADPAKQFLTISGTVIGAANTLKSRYPVERGPLRLHTTTAMMGEVAKGAVGPTFFRAYNAGSETLTPQVVEKPKHMAVTFKPERVAPGEQFIISLNSFTSDCPEWGLVTDTIVIKPDAASDSLIQLTSVITIREDFSKLSPRERENAPVITIEPQQLDLGRLSADSAPIHRTLTITNTGAGAPLLLRRVTTPDPAITVTPSATKIAKGKEAQIEVTIDPSRSADPAMINGRITIISNDPTHATQIVRVVGELTH